MYLGKCGRGKEIALVEVFGVSSLSYLVPSSSSPDTIPDFTSGLFLALIVQVQYKPSVMPQSSLSHIK